MEHQARHELAARRRRYRRIAVGSLLLIVSMAMLLPLGGYLYVGIQEAGAQAVQETNPRSNTWRAVRSGVEGYSAVRGQETGVLIQDGQNWRQLRNGYVANYGGWFLFVVFLAVTIFFTVKGQQPIEGGRSGRRVRRWHALERLLHWAVAVLFVVLAITGLSLLFGRAVLIPLMGAKGFAAWADLAMGLHNNVGPWFGALVVVMIVVWMRRNLPEAIDWEWLKQGGGIFKKGHPPAGFANAGEKIWFWFIATVGLVVIASGLVLDFPNWGFTRDQMQLANLIHGACAIAWVALWFGHAYIGTLGTEGALEGMTTGYVDEHWAKQHHDVWFEELSGKGATGETPAAAGSADGEPTVTGGSAA